MTKRITAGDYCPSMDEVFYAEMADYENGDEMADYGVKAYNTAGDYCPSMDEVFYAEMADYEN